MRLEEFLTHVPDAHKNGRGWEARCPAHDDHDPSLGIDEKNGKILITCRSQHCPNEAIVGALGLTMADLFVEPLAVTFSPPQPRRVTATYDYRDEAGDLLYQTLRYEPGKNGKPKDFSQRRPDGNGDWFWNLDDTRRVLYRLPELLAAKPSRWVFLPEGERDAETLRAWNLVATTSVGGTESWRPEYAEALRGRLVAILEDNDLPGMKLARTKAESLLGVAAQVRIVKLPVENPKEDVTDWRDRYGGTREALTELVLAAAPYVHEAEPAPDPCEGWEPPLDLVEPDLPTFPVHALPGWLGDMVEAVAVSRQVPVDLAAMVGLVTVAAAVARKVEIQMRAGWLEPLNLYGVAVQPPAARKSTVFGDMTRPLKNYVERRRRADEKRVRALEVEFDIAKARVNEAKRKAALAKSLADRERWTEEARGLAMEMIDMPPPHRFQLTADDATPERLTSLLHEQGGRIALLSTEGGVFDIMAGRYSNGVPNLDVYLKAHPGDTIMVDRVGRAGEIIHKPALTVALVVQPEVIRGLAGKRVFRGKGLLGRFLYAVPESTVGHRAIEGPPIPLAIEEAYAENLDRLLEVRGEWIGGDEHPHILHLDEDAHALRREFEEWIEPRLAEFGELGHISDWAGKLAGHVGRIAGLIHMGAHAKDDRPWEYPVTGWIFGLAVEIGKYLIPHARAAFAEMGSDPVVRGARLVLRWIDKTGCVEFTQRDLHRSLQGSVPKSAHLTYPLALLEERGYLRRRDEGRFFGAGQNPSPTFEVNPLFLKGIKKNY